MTQVELVRAIGSMAQIMARDPETHAEMASLFITLCESLVEITAQQMPSRSRKAERLARLAQIMRENPHSTADERMAALGVGRSYYFELQRSLRDVA